MKVLKRIAIVLMSLVISAMVVGCSKNEPVNNTESVVKTESVAKLNMAYQFGLAYEPVILCKLNGTIEKEYEKLTGKKLEITWNQMNSGADINTGIASGSIDVGFLGFPPALTGISKKLGYKIFSNISGTEFGCMTNDDSVKSFADLIGSNKQIAVVNIGATQHIVLGKALSEHGYGAHDLDSNLVAMKHPDGMSSLVSGAIACHVTTSPYIQKERDTEGLHELNELKESWDLKDTHIVGVAAETLKNDSPDVYKALCNAIATEIDNINKNPEEVAKLTAELNGNTVENELKYIKEGFYSVNTKGLFKLSKFMSQNGFLDTEFSKYEDLVFDNVKGD